MSVIGQDKGPSVLNTYLFWFNKIVTVCLLNANWFLNIFAKD